VRAPLEMSNGSKRMSNSHAVRNALRFVVLSRVELDDGVILTPGIYEGRITHLGYIKHEETVWTPKRYFLELDAEHDTDMGGEASGHMILAEYDVTKYVENGLILLE
jgi:hypothetical protein